MGEADPQAALDRARGRGPLPAARGEHAAGGGARERAGRAVQHGLTRMPIDIRQKLRQVGVLGAGTMGNGIAQAFAVAGYSVIMRDIKPEYVERGMATVAKSLERLAARGKLSADARAATLARIRPTTDINDLGQCDLVVEAVLEDYELKAGIIRELDSI